MSRSPGGAVRILAAALVIAATVVVLPATAPGATATTCVEPEAEYRYTAAEMAYELIVDFRGCSWWHDTSAVLDGFLVGQQAAGLVSTREFETNGVTFCDEPTPVATCSLVITLPHEAPEVAQYSGRISYPWEDGRRVEEFAATCFSGAGQAKCRPQEAG